jgi:hypothetical protein
VRARSKHIATITSPCRGVATYRNETGAFVYHAHWSADPLKDNEWADMVASTYPGGRQSIEFLQEFEADDEAKSGERLYWAFERERNVIDPIVIPPDWPVFLGADFGQRNPTAIVFLAQDPGSKTIYVFDSIYQPKGIDIAIKQTIYEKLGRHFGLELSALEANGAHRYIERAVCDPTASPYVAFYAMDPYPIYFLTNVVKKTGLLSKHRTGESKVNSALWPSFVCCDKRQYPPNQLDPPDLYPCTICKTPRAPQPMLYIFEGAAVELVAEYEGLIDKEPAYEGLETPEKVVRVPDHASDSLRYVLHDMELGLDVAPSTQEEADRRIEKIREKPKNDRSFGDHIEILMANVQDQQERYNHMRESRGKLTFSRYGVGSRIRYRTPQVDA